MIKIIEPGTKKITYCEDCGCKFSYEKEDVQEVSSSSISKSVVAHKIFVMCPQCHKQKILEQAR